MLESLQERLARVTKTLRGEGHLTEYHVDTALREIRVALLGADVAVEVVSRFVERVRERALGKEVLNSVTPAQMVTKIVHEELVALMGGTTAELNFKGRPAVVMLVGLQGSGKTTSAAKIGYWLKQKKNLFPLLVPADTSRPAAREQLLVLGEKTGIPTLDTREMTDPEAIATMAMREAMIKGYQVLVFDTAGRLHVDDDLMDELQRVKAILKPKHVLFVADAMTGQDAVRSARSFNERIELSGVVLTKLDGDAKGGAALSVAEVVGRPIVFAGVGERFEDLEQFHPDRMAGRILGMGDVLTLVEKAQDVVDERKAKRLEAKMRKNQFDLEDLRDQLRGLKKMGPPEPGHGDDPGDEPARTAGRHQRHPGTTTQAHGGVHRLHDTQGAPPSPGTERIAQETNREGFGHLGGRNQSPVAAVRTDAQADEAAREG
jgi:signal recognition particle subunit SRP54